MKVRATTGVWSIAVAAALLVAGAASVTAQEQEKEHAVSARQLRTDVEKAAETRQVQEAAVREMFASEAAKEKLKAAGIDYKQVDQAISQVNDQELASMAERAQEVNKDFAAGRLGDRDLLIILLVAVVLILVIVAVR